MDWLRELVFGSPWSVIIGAAIVLMVLLWLLRMLVRWFIVVAVAGALLIGALVAADLLVQTDREQIEQLTRDAVAAAGDSDAEGLTSSAAMADDFDLRIEGRTIAANRLLTLGTLKTTFLAYKVQSASVTHLAIEVRDNQASVAMTMKADVGMRLGGSGGGLGGPRPTVMDWDLTFAKNPRTGQWQMTSADLRRVNHQSAGSLRRLIPGSG